MPQKQALVVHAHPERESFVAAMRDAAIAELRKQQFHVTVSDLYAQGFDPVAKAEDFSNRRNPDYLVYALEQRHAYTNISLADDIACELKKVLAADTIVFTFPIFWFSAPAILKGWFDRVLLSGPVYGGRRFYDRGGLAGKRAILGISLGGREHMFGPNSVHGDLQHLLSHILRGTLGYSGLQVTEPFFAFHIPYLDEQDRNAVLSRWRQHLAKLEDLPALPMPSLDEFDDQMAPLPTTRK